MVVCCVYSHAMKSLWSCTELRPFRHHHRAHNNYSYARLLPRAAFPAYCFQWCINRAPDTNEASRYPGRRDKSRYILSAAGKYRDCVVQYWNRLAALVLLRWCENIIIAHTYTDTGARPYAKKVWIWIHLLLPSAAAATTTVLRSQSPRTPCITVTMGQFVPYRLCKSRCILHLYCADYRPCVRVCVGYLPCVRAHPMLAHLHNRIRQQLRRRNAFITAHDRSAHIRTVSHRCCAHRSA